LKALGFEPLGPEVFLAQSCERFARALNIQPPQLGTMEGFNAFAMGTDRNDATITLGRPLLDALTPEEAEAVLAHEIAHAAAARTSIAPILRPPVQNMTPTECKNTWVIAGLDGS
jgi:Zn-dependent protease with chaperone function